jgi:hypothetical protein
MKTIKIIKVQITISDCSDCPHCGSPNNNGWFCDSKWVCLKTRRKNNSTETEYGTIPLWCPLIKRSKV